MCLAKRGTSINCHDRYGKRSISTINAHRGNLKHKVRFPGASLWFGISILILTPHVDLTAGEYTHSMYFERRYLYN